MKMNIAQRICLRAADILEEEIKSSNSEDIQFIDATIAFRQATNELTKFWGEYTAAKNIVHNFLCQKKRINIHLKDIFVDEELIINIRQSVQE